MLTPKTLHPATAPIEEMFKGGCEGLAHSCLPILLKDTLHPELDPAASHSHS